MRVRIDKSLFTAEELEQYNALLAKATVDPEANQEEFDDDDFPPVPPKKTKKAEVEDMEDAKKSADPQITAALTRLEALEKSLAMQEFTAVAKKYEPLGEDTNQLAETLYNMKKSSEANYNAYIDVLNKSLDVQEKFEKSGLFGEIGKSASGMTGGGSAESKIEAIANDIMKADPTISRPEAITKAWDNHPELVAEYDREYRGRR